MALSELLDTDVAYATAEDVEDFTRAKTFGPETNPTKERIEQKLLSASDTVDKLTRRSWRERRVNDRELKVETSRAQERRLEERRSGTRVLPRSDNRAVVNLPHESIKDFDPEKGDTLEVLLPREVNDITAEEGRDKKWVMDYRAGVLRLDLTLFRRGPLRKRGTGLLKNMRIRITYRYGRSPDSIPGDIREATAKLVAADVIDSDAYSDRVPGGDSAPDQQTSSQKYEEEARETLRGDYKYAKVM